MTESGYEALRETLDEKLTAMEIANLMKVSYPTAIYRLHKHNLRGTTASQNQSIKLYDRDDVIELLKAYNVLG